MGVGGGFVFMGFAPIALAMPPPRLNNSIKKERNNDSLRKILVLMTNTGGGHKASAQAIKAGFQEVYNDKYDISIVDAFADYTPWPMRTFPNGYSFLVKHSFLWRIMYTALQPRIVHYPYFWLWGLYCSKKFGKIYSDYEPDLVVSVHPLLQHIPIKILKKRIRNGQSPPTNFATVVTDFTTGHNTWFHPGVTKCFVATDYTKKLALRMGLKEEQIVVHGLPIRPAFSSPISSKENLRKKLQMVQNTPGVLLIGGGEGMGKIEATVDAIANIVGDKCQVVVICGRNKVLVDKLNSKNYPMHIVVTGFVDNMHEYMGACDVIVTKAGPGTIAEALIAGLPILLNGNIPCQEEGNIPYVVDNGVGAFEKNPQKIAQKLLDWFLDEGKLEEMSKNSKALGKPDSLWKIVRDLAGLCEDSLRQRELAAAESSFQYA
eukprot:TRINITY_DN10731_c0_g2_i3.p1 TRINITY_DN10731_c0_g2~~TRINITY_DN10731_c0_g2_i3.p1  ORF type:complete len:448 (-),score=81.67 TRINITY_DN10731_c0_g2_i3:2713-4008(-)